jgi:DNA helicase II / ATP-dependent DNA helicase PcrA
LIDFLASLNEPQLAAVTHTEGPLMIIAGAGSGKTRVLTYRIAHLMGNGVDAFNILALTFTNKAAQEMRNRIEKIIGSEAKNLWMGTFHSIFAKILRFEGSRLGYTSNFTIYDTDDSKSLLKTIIKELKLDDKTYKANFVLNRISGAKNNLITWQAYADNPIFQAEDTGAQMPDISTIYRIYSQRCFAANAMDFDDLLFNTNVLFRDHLDVLNKYQHKFKHVMVDEFQDTNISQYLITKKLSAVSQNICVVGDDAQSIYAFRGANIQNILNFKKDYPELVVVKLEQNYRSTKNIVNAASSVIAKNKAQLDKTIFSDNEEGEKIAVLKAHTDNEEGKMVSNLIFETKMNEGYQNADFAILYRTNSQSRAFEEALRRINIKYRIIGGMSFYQRKEIKDLLAYMRYTVNQQDEEAFKRVINYPKRGIGDTTIAKIVVTANENGKTIWEVVSNAGFYFDGKASGVLEGFGDLIKSYGVSISQGKDAHIVALHIAKTSGLLHELYSDKTVEGLARHENVQELLNSIKQFVDNPEIEDKSLGAFLQNVSLLTNADTQDENDADTVTMMTIHGAKGLEFKHVFVVGMEENLFPSQMMLRNKEDLEEERRLFYVAITRAEKRLTLSYAEQRYTWGKVTFCEKSRFLEEIDPKYLKVLEAPQVSQDRGGFDMPSWSRPTSKPIEPMASQKARTLANLKPVSSIKPSQGVYVPSLDFQGSDTTNLKGGDKVEHQKFGFGIVKKVDFLGPTAKAIIDFEGEGEKTLLLSFAKLKIIV